MKLACQEGLAPGESLKEKFENLKKYGFEAVELSGEKLWERKREIIDASRETGIELGSVCGGFPCRFVAAERKEREEAISSLKKLLETMGEMEVTGIMMVPIFGPPEIPDLSPYKGPLELEREVLLSELPHLAQFAQDSGTFIWLEPLNRYETHFITRLNQAVEICQKVNNPNLRIMADFFHMHIEEVNIGESLKKAKDWLGHIHLADSNRFLPGQGHIDFRPLFKVLNEINYKGYMALECGILGEPEEELLKCVKYLKKCIQE